MGTVSFVCVTSLPIAAGGKSDKKPDGRHFGYWLEVLFLAGCSHLRPPTSHSPGGESRMCQCIHIVSGAWHEPHIDQWVQACSRWEVRSLFLRHVSLNAFNWKIKFTSVYIRKYIVYDCLFVLLPKGTISHFQSCYFTHCCTHCSWHDKLSKVCICLIASWWQVRKRVYKWEAKLERRLVETIGCHSKGSLRVPLASFSIAS